VVFKKISTEEWEECVQFPKKGIFASISAPTTVNILLIFNENEVLPVAILTICPSISAS